MTEVVPAPDEPVIAITGYFFDILGLSWVLHLAYI
jgi:hypothetical protein